MRLGSSLEILYLSEEGQPLHLGGGDVLGVGGQEGLAGVHLLHQVLALGTADQPSLAVRETRKSKIDLGKSGRVK
jgi:hypothetical protein